MTEGSLSAGQRRIVRIIQELAFGRIAGLWIREGQPVYDPQPRIVQDIKLGAKNRGLDHGPVDFTLKTEFESLFNQLSCLPDSVVDIEVRHGVPFRLLLERSYTDFE